MVKFSEIELVTYSAASDSELFRVGLAQIPQVELETSGAIDCLDIDDMIHDDCVGQAYRPAYLIQLLTPGVLFTASLNVFAFISHFHILRYVLGV